MESIFLYILLASHAPWDNSTKELKIFFHLVRDQKLDPTIYKIIEEKICSLNVYLHIYALCIDLFIYTNVYKKNKLFFVCFILHMKILTLINIYMRIFYYVHKFLQ